MPQLTCPPRKTLLGWAEGELLPSDSESLETHVAECSTCQGALSEDDTANPLVRALRPVSFIDTSRDRDPSLSEALQSVKRLVQQMPETPRTLPGPIDSGGEPAEDEPLDFLDPPTRPDSIGRLGRFHVLDRLGSGGVGIVFKALDSDLGRAVALKILKPAIAGDFASRQRFLREARAAALVRHPNICSIHEVGEHAGRLFLAMELIEGGSLAQRLAGVPQPPRQAAQLVETLARAIHAAHEQGIIHRDLKPGNVLLREVESGELRVESQIDAADAAARPSLNPQLSTLNPFISDFGLAKSLSDDATQTKTGLILGTPSYMAPEQAGGKTKEIGPAADIYALGAILYELLTGRPPFRGETTFDTIQQVLSDDPVPPRRLQPKVARDLETICLKCLEKSPAKRYATAELLAADLQRFLNGEPVHARPANVLERGVKWARRSPVKAAAGVVAALALFALAVSTALVWRANREANRQRDVAKKNAIEAGDERERATHRAKQARQAVDEMYTEVAEQWLANQAYLEELQQKFLIRTRDFYEDLAAEQSEDASVLTEVAEAHRRVGQIHLRFGDLVKAEPALDQAVAICRGLAEREIEKPQYLRLLATALRDRSALDIAAHRFREAEQRIRDSIDLGRQYCSFVPENPQGRLDLAQSYRSLAEAYIKCGRFGEAEEPSLEATALLQQLTAEFPEEPKCVYALATGCKTTGLALACTGNLTAAQEYYRLGLSCLESLLAEHPTRPDYRMVWAQIQNNVSRAQIENGQEEAAEAAFHNAVRVWNNLVADFPNADAYRESQIQTYINFYTLLALTGKYRRAADVCREALTKHPANSTAREALAWLLADSPDLDLRDIPEAIRFAEELVQLDPDGAGSWNVLGLALYRAGNWEASIAAFRKSIETGVDIIGSPAEPPHWGVPSLYPYRSNRFFLAMAYWRIGERDEARNWYEDGRRCMEQYNLDDDTIGAFHPWDWLPEPPAKSHKRLERYRWEAMELFEAK